MWSEMGLISKNRNMHRCVSSIGEHYSNSDGANLTKSVQKVAVLEQSSICSNKVTLQTEECGK